MSEVYCPSDITTPAHGCRQTLLHSTHPSLSHPKTTEAHAWPTAARWQKVSSTSHSALGTATWFPHNAAGNSTTPALQAKPTRSLSMRSGNSEIALPKQSCSRTDISTTRVTPPSFPIIG